MKKIKKTCNIIVLTFVVLSMLSGCGGRTSSTKESPYQIDWFFIGDPQLDVAEVETAIADYLKDSLNVTVKLNALDWTGIRERINIMAAGSEKFDLTFTDIQNYNALVSKNAFKPLNDLLDKYAPETKKILGDNFLKGSQINGINYAIPVNKEQGHHYGILYQKDIADKHNLTDQLNNVKTLDDMIPIWDYIKKNEPTYYPYREFKGLDAFSTRDFETIVFPAAFYPDSNDGKVVNLVETPEFMKAAKETRARYEAGYLPEGGSMNAVNDKFFSLLYALKPGKDKEMSAKTNWVQIDLTMPRMQLRDTMGSMLAISKTSKKPERVMQFIELLYTDSKLLNLIVYGIEGKHYTKISDKKIEAIKDSGYSYSSMRWQFGNTFNQYLLKDEMDDKVEKMLDYNANLKTSNYLGFNVDTSNLKTQIGACLNVQAEFEVQISEGLEKPELVVPQYIQKLKLAGADDIIVEVQRQYDEWKAKNK